MGACRQRPHPHRRSRLQSHKLRAHQGAPLPLGRREQQRLQGQVLDLPERPPGQPPVAQFLHRPDASRMQRCRSLSALPLPSLSRRLNLLHQQLLLWSCRRLSPQEDRDKRAPQLRWTRQQAQHRHPRALNASGLPQPANHLSRASSGASGDYQVPPQASSSGSVVFLPRTRKAAIAVVIQCVRGSSWML